MEDASEGRRYAGQSAAARRADRRRRLLRTATTLIGDEGYAAVAVDRLCAVAAVSHRTFYEEFGNREQLLIAAHTEILEAARDAVLQALAAADPTDTVAARIAAGLRAYLRVTAGDPGVARLCFLEVIGVSDTVEEHRARWRAWWVEMITASIRLVTEGTTSTAQPSPEGSSAPSPRRLAAVVLIAALNALAHDLASGNSTEQEVTDELTRLAEVLFETRGEAGTG